MNKATTPVARRLIERRPSSNKTVHHPRDSLLLPMRLAQVSTVTRPPENMTNDRFVYEESKFRSPPVYYCNYFMTSLFTPTVSLDPSSFDFKLIKRNSVKSDVICHEMKSLEMYLAECMRSFQKTRPLDSAHWRAAPENGHRAAFMKSGRVRLSLARSSAPLSPLSPPRSSLFFKHLSRETRRNWCSVSFRTSALSPRRQRAKVMLITDGKACRILFVDVPGVASGHAAFAV